jgi:cytidine deaminase
MSIMELSERDRELVDRALDARSNAYAPYSDYPVGAALRTDSGEVYTGVNVENAAFPLSMCAERSAVFSAVTAGDKNFQAIAVATRNGGSPCGSCRQVLSEFGLETRVLIADQEGKVLQVTTVGELLPGQFGGNDLS